jgi:hypothetical protein
MLTKDKKHLMVIQNFFEDESLPKFEGLRKKKEESKRGRRTFGYSGATGVSIPDDQDNYFGDSDSLGFADSTPSGFTDDGWITNAGGVIRVNPEDEGYWDGVTLRTKNALANMFIQQHYDYLIGKRTIRTRNPLKKFLWWFVKKIYRKYVIVSSSGTIEEFFVNLKQSPQEISKADLKLQSYKEYLEKCKASGQVALAEKVKESVYIAGREAQMYSMDLTKFLTEEQIIDFVKKTERGLRMDWIKNFTRHIPDDVLATKKRADELHIFDNYCVLHYDPDNKGAELTKKEKQRKKDPILFGLLKGSSNLYFVGDWIDEFCDLTLDKIVETVGEAKEITEDYVPND